MKNIKLILTVLIVATPSLAQADYVTEEIGEIMQKYEACTGENYDENSLKKFEKMFSAMKADQENSKSSKYEVTDFGYHSITILDQKNKKECVLNIDVYDGRCVYAICQ